MTLLILLLFIQPLGSADQVEMDYWQCIETDGTTEEQCEGLPGEYEWVSP